MNPLTLIPALYRKWVYGLYALAIIAVTAVQVWAAAVPGTAVPSWTVRALAVLAYIGIPLGLTAASNVSPEDRPRPAPKDKGLLG